MCNQSTKIKEIFSSIQGEGIYVGQYQTFIRFCKCNLACKYCDTDFNESNTDTYKVSDIINLLNCETISLTGGEPLLETDFLIELFKKAKPLNKKFYLETNGTLVEELKKVIDYIDVISMDIKIESATGQKNNFSLNREFLEIANKKEAFIKVVFDKNITDYEIEEIIKIASLFNTTIVLQPKMPLSKDLDLIKIFEKFYKNYKNVRLIPQTHKFLNII